MQKSTKIKVLLLVLLTWVFLPHLQANNNNTNISLVSFLERVSQQNNINIYIDEDLKDKKVSIFIPDKISNSDLFSLFNITVKKMKYNLIKTGNSYYISLIPSSSSKDYLYNLKYNSYSDCKSVLDILQIKHSYLKDINSILLSTTDKKYKEIQFLLNQTDVKQKQVILKIMIYEFNDEDRLDSGVKFSSIYKGVTGATEIALNAIVAPISNKTNLLLNTDFYGAITLLNEHKKIKVKQFPYVLAKNNKSFKFEAVDNIPYLSKTTKTDSNTVSEENSINYKDVGLKINGRALIYDDYITLDLDLIIEDLIISDNDDKTPSTFKRHLNSNTNIDFNKVLLLSGIKRTKNYINNYNIPFLSNIPYLGEIFKYKTSGETELNITIAIEVIKK